MINHKEELNRIFNSPWPDPDPFRELDSKGIAIYGAGPMGRMALNCLSEVGLVPEYFIDKNYEGEINGIKVILPGKIPQNDFKTLTFIVSIATVPINPIIQYLKNFGCLDVRHFYDYSEKIFPEIMPNGWVVSDLDSVKRKRIQKVCNILEHDDYSLAHYYQFLWWRIKRREVLYPDYPVLTGHKYFKSPTFPELSTKETLVDGGAHHGQTISDFYKVTVGKYDHIWAFEPDEFNLSVLSTYIDSQSIHNTTIYSEALFDKCSVMKFKNKLGYASKIEEEGNVEIETVTLDSLSDICPTIIKLHIEGGELYALYGAIKTIKKYRPILMVVSDHNSDGLCAIPEFLSELKEYKIFFNLHDYCGNSAVFYAYPIERL